MVLFFDLDDTLLDDRAAKNHYMPRLYARFKDIIKGDEQGFYEAWRNAIGKYHAQYAVGKLTFEEQRVMRVRDSFGDWHMSDSRVSEVICSFDKLFREAWQPFPDTIRALNSLSGFRKGVITNGSAQQQNDKLDVLGVRHFFDCIIVSETAGVAKPDVRIFKKACDGLECSPSESLFIGDSWELDMIGSYNAGMVPVWFNPAKKPVPEKLERLIVIERLEQVYGICHG